MLNPRALAAAVVATGAGAVIFLSTGQSPATPESGGGPVPGIGQPVAIPPSVSEAPSPQPAVPAAEHVPPPSTTAPAPTVKPTPKRPATTAPARKTAPKRSASPHTAPPTQQPQPAGTEPNGTGGWQLTACYDTSCEASQAAPATVTPQTYCQGTGTECLNYTLGQLGIYNDIPALIGGH